MVVHNLEQQKLFEKLILKYKRALFDPSEEGSIGALEYLRGRGITEDIIDKFNIGWNPSDKIINDNKMLVGRIIFPIQDEFGSIIALSGRLPKEKKDIENMIPHWFHTSFEKSFFVYGLNESWPFILNSGSVIIVEGQVDMISLFSRGIKNVVGLIGSCLTEENLAKLLKFTNKFFICMDGDESGRKVSVSIIEIIRSYLGYNSAIEIPMRFGKDKNSEYDPDEFVTEFGKDGFVKLINYSIEKHRNKERES